ncbi:ABC transporter substrate-binding protein [Propionivibrio limicola]|uniref:ABC transporter substrate-binding protein n=1 Tax=Propionivibrio limicola TaxID=167645 RepID=UPI0012909597|nr:ABC transporter substrate-binding protein [Propionivibrio limicola]
MKLTLIRLLSVLFALSGLFGAWASRAESNASETVNVQLRWMHQFQFAGYYVALEKGFYQEAGLDVRLLEGGPGKLPVDEVLSGRAQYGAANSEVLYERLRGQPLVALAAIFQHSPSVLVTRADSGIRTPHDLVGKKVMLMRGRHDSDFYAMLLHEGVKPETVNIQPTSYDIKDLVAGKVDAFNSYLTNEPFVLRQLGIEYNVINPSHYGIDYYGDILFTSEDELRQHPERVKMFRAATLRGWNYAMEHPDEVIDLLLDKYRVPKTREHLQFEAEAMRSLVLPAMVEIGHMNRWRWQSMVDAFKETGMAASDARLDGFIYDPDVGASENRMRRIVWGLLWGILAALAIVSAMGVMLYRLRKEVVLRKSAEERLMRLNSSLRRTNEMARIGGWERDIGSHTIILSAEAARIRELPPGSVLKAEEALSFYAPEERPARMAEVERAINDGTPWEHESLLTLPSGR